MNQLKQNTKMLAKDIENMDFVLSHMPKDLKKREREEKKKKDLESIFVKKKVKVGKKENNIKKR